MSQLLANSTTVNDICTAALLETRVFGIGQAPTGNDITDAWARLQWMLQQWARKRWLVYHLITLGVTATGSQTYTVGPGQQFDVGAGNTRPDRLEAAFIRFLNSSPQQVDYPLKLLQSMEDYSRVTLKNLVSFPNSIFYDPGWATGTLYPWPIPQASLYGLYCVFKAALPTQFPTLATAFVLPPEYFSAMVYNLAIRLCPKYGKSPDAMTVGMAKEGLNVLRGSYTAISELTMPQEILRPGIYNIFGDTAY